MSFPNKEERSKCWGARDTYWSCLDKHHIKDSPQETKEKEQGPCAEFRRIYENSCTAQWVKHFDRKRSYIQFKEKIEKEGYEPLNEENKTKI